MGQNNDTSLAFHTSNHWCLICSGWEFRCFSPHLNCLKYKVLGVHTAADENNNFCFTFDYKSYSCLSRCSKLCLYPLPVWSTWATLCTLSAERRKEGTGRRREERREGEKKTQEEVKEEVEVERNKRGKGNEMEMKKMKVTQQVEFAWGERCCRHMFWVYWYAASWR